MLSAGSPGIRIVLVSLAVVLGQAERGPERRPVTGAGRRPRTAYGERKQRMYVVFIVVE